MKFGKKEKETQEEEVVRGEIQRVDSGLPGRS